MILSRVKWFAVVISIFVVGCKAEPKDVKAEVAQKLAGIQAGEERNIGSDVFLMAQGQQLQNPLGDGWHLATSAEGGFTVEIPIPYNVARIRAKTTDKVEFRTHIVGAKTAGLLSYSANCIVRRDGKLGPQGRTPRPEVFETRGTPISSHSRSIEFAGRTCILTVERQGTDALPDEALRLRFLNSMKLTGAPTW